MQQQIVQFVLKEDTVHNQDYQLLMVYVILVFIVVQGLLLQLHQQEDLQHQQESARQEDIASKDQNTRLDVHQEHSVLLQELVYQVSV